VHVLGKGRKRRAIPLDGEILRMLERYAPPAGVPHLFGRPSDLQRRLAPYAVEQRIPRLARRAGIVELRVTPHVLRHTFGSLMLAADPTALIPTRDLMGHESVETTNKYAHTREEARRLALASMQELRSRLHDWPAFVVKQTINKRAYCNTRIKIGVRKTQPHAPAALLDIMRHVFGLSMHTYQLHVQWTFNDDAIKSLAYVHAHWYFVFEIDEHVLAYRKWSLDTDQHAIIAQVDDACS
jgi:Phage integrase family